jgi:tetratricopeptide (TPR) repeat protein
MSKYIELMSEQIRMSRELGNRMQEIIALSNIGESYSQLGLYELARTSLEQAKASAEAIGARRFRALAVWNLGSVYLQMSHIRRAEALLNEALEELRATGDRYGEGGVQLLIALVLEQLGDLSGAQRRYVLAREELEEMGIAARVAEATAGLARCALAQGRLDEAKQHVQLVAQFLNQDGAAAENPFPSYQTCVEVYLALGEQELAREMARLANRELLARADRISNPEWRRSFLENVPENSAIVELEQRLNLQLPSITTITANDDSGMVVVATREERV